MRMSSRIAILLVLGGIVHGLAAADDSADATTATVLSFNIRYGTANDRDNSWPRRKELVFNVIRDQDSDFVGLQEALRFQIDTIHEAIPGYSEVGVGRDDGEEAGEYSAILYKRDRWRAEESGTFWLSDTPDVVGSTSWGNSTTRIVTFARFSDQSTERGVWVFNTHFDHRSQPSREKGAELLMRRIAGRTPTDPVIVTGDFNAGEDNRAIEFLTGQFFDSAMPLIDTFRVLHPDAEHVGTFNAFSGRSDGAKIDYVFVEAGTRVLQAEIIRDHDDGRYPSDHFPVSAEIALPPK